MSNKIVYSVVVPVFNSLALNELVESFKETILDTGYPAELILVDDESAEKTKIEAEHLALQNAFVTTIRLKKNVGQIAATMCGVHHANGQIIITMDDDLQYPMKEAVNLIGIYHKFKKQIIFGYPRERMHNFQHNATAQLVIWLFDYIVLPKYRKINFYTSFRIFNRSLIVGNPEAPIGGHLFYIWDIPISEMLSIPVTHRPRKTGKSNYTIRKKISTLKAPLFFCIQKLSLYFIIFLLSLTLLLAFKNPLNHLFFIVVFCCVFFVFLFLRSKKMLEKCRVVKYEVEKITHNDRI